MIVAPKGERASFAILKHCFPNGIPIIVQYKRIPFSAADIASGMPLKTSQTILAKVEIAPPPYTISFLNGTKARDANLKHCFPIGKPIIVMHHMIPENDHPIPCQNPPHKNHIIFPRQLIIKSPNYSTARFPL